MSNTNTLLKEFILESTEGINCISEALTKLEKNPGDQELLNTLYRAVHTVKGGSRFLKLNKLEEIAHALENPLDLVREGKLLFTTSLVDVLLLGTDLMSNHLKSLDESEIEANVDSSSLLSKIHEFVSNQIDPVIPRESELILPNPFALNTPDALIAPEVFAPSMAPVVTTVLAAPRNEVTPPEKSTTDSVVRVNVELLDKIMNVVGELVLTRNQILQFANLSDSSDLQRLSTQLNSITTELQGDIMTTRMQPIGSILTRFERIVRDMSRDLGKKVSLKIEGKDTELDKTLLEAIKDPLTHMVRNAVDHGLETTEERLKNGKSEEGTLQIRAYHEGGQVTIEITDDGRGIKKQKILNKAIEKGLVSPDLASKMSEREVLDIIFYPGFSTAAQVTNISGRGVGMDVVKTNVEKIGGQVDVSSTEGAGTTLKMRIPLTLAIIPALIVTDAKEAFAVPQINLVELVRLEGEKLSLIEKINDSEFFRLRGELIPIIRLMDALELNNDLSRPNKEAENIVVLNAEGRIFGLIVDSILDTQEIVVKPLSKQIKSIGTYAGATIMGDGRVALILDVIGLAAKFSLKVDKVRSEDNRATSVITDLDSQEILAFKLNAKGSYAVPLVVVHRLEEFALDKIEFVGDTEVIQYRGQPMPLVRFESVLGLKPDLTKKAPDVVPVFVTRFSDRYFGFVVNEIMDTALVHLDLRNAPVEQNGILGSVTINEKLVSLVDVYWIAEKLNLNRKAGAKASKVAPINKRKPVVLVAEDTPLFRRMAEQTFTSLGFDVHVGEDGAIAFQKLKNLDGAVDLIVSDIEMPNMNGLEFIQSVRTLPNCKNTPCVALTSRFSSQDIENGITAGFDRYLEKFKKDEIITVITELMNEKRKAS